VPISFKACNPYNHIYHIDAYGAASNDSTGGFEIKLFYREYSDSGPTEYVVAIIRTTDDHVIFERLFEKNQPTKIIDCGFYEAIEKFDDNCESYAKEFEQNHR
jgi:hypothetical protein